MPSTGQTERISGRTFAIYGAEASTSLRYPASAIADTSWIKPVKDYAPITYSTDLVDHLSEELMRALKSGAAGVSIDLMHRSDQQMIALYRRAAKAAADYHLRIEFLNGPTPDGIERTWPNVVPGEDVPFKRLLGSF